MTAAELDRAKQTDLLDLGGYIDHMRPEMVASQGNWAAPFRLHQIHRPVLHGGVVIMQDRWLMTEGLN